MKRIRHRHRKGLTLIELLVAVVLMAIVMGSVAVAMHASVDNYTTNESVAIATQAARSVLNRIADDVRTASSASSANAKSLTVTPHSLLVSKVDYIYNGTTLVWKQTKLDGTVTEEILLGDDGDEVKMVDFDVSTLTGTDASGNACVKNVALKLKVKVGEETLLMRASASPRRNQIY